MSGTSHMRYHFHYSSDRWPQHHNVMESPTSLTEDAFNAYERDRGFGTPAPRKMPVTLDSPDFNDQSSTGRPLGAPNVDILPTGGARDYSVYNTPPRGPPSIPKKPIPAKSGAVLSAQKSLARAEAKLVKLVGGKGGQSAASRFLVEHPGFGGVTGRGNAAGNGARSARPLSAWAQYVKTHSSAIRSEYASAIAHAKATGNRGGFFQAAKAYALAHGNFQFGAGPKKPRGPRKPRAAVKGTRAKPDGGKRALSAAQLMALAAGRKKRKQSILTKARKSGGGKKKAKAARAPAGMAAIMKLLSAAKKRKPAKKAKKPKKAKKAKKAKKSKAKRMPKAGVAGLLKALMGVRRAAPKKKKATKKRSVGRAGLLKLLLGC